MVNEMAALQAVRLKGRPTVADVAASAGADEAAAKGALDALISAGHAEEANDRFRITPDGKARLEDLVAGERAVVDTDEVKAEYDEFTPLNSEFKEIVTAWQQRDGEPNDHQDAAYDSSVVERLAGLDQRFRPLLERMVETAPRLAPYPARLDLALENLRGGDSAWFARPLIDSYHTVWFELHEDLIGLAGLSREAEAAEGRA